MVMERAFAIVILAVIHGLIFLLLIAILLSDKWRRSHFRRRKLSRRANRIEQLLISETIASCVLEKDLGSLIMSLGKRAAELNGCEEWIVWLEDGEGKFSIVGMESEEISNFADVLSEADESQFFNWVRNNAAPMMLDKRMEAMAESEVMRAALRHLAPGVVVPFLDGEKLVGLLIMGGMLSVRERRSEQFLTLFGAFAAILIRKAILDEEERRMRERQQRAENLSAMGKVAAGVAHEIRNPLTFIRSAAEQLHEASGLETSDGELIHGMIEEIDRINTRIEELRSLTRIDTGAFAPVDLMEVIRGTIRLVEIRARECGVQVKFLPAAGRMDVLGNVDKLRQLFLNLMLNGIEAMRQGGYLTVRSKVSDQCALIEVEDTGSGISKEASKYIFQPFYTTKDGGTGLGLALCYSIASSHGGVVELSDTGPDGTCFTVELPVNQPELESMRAGENSRRS